MVGTAVGEAVVRRGAKRACEKTKSDKEARASS